MQSRRNRRICTFALAGVGWMVSLLPAVPAWATPHTPHDPLSPGAVRPQHNRPLSTHPQQPLHPSGGQPLHPSGGQPLHPAPSVRRHPSAPLQLPAHPG